jgi:4-hydroxybenzoate polyprenyltransferase
MITIASAGMLYGYLQLHLNTWIVAFSVLLTLLYALPLLPFRPFRLARKAGVLKTTLLAFTWTFVTAFIPLQKTLLQVNGADLFLLTRRFLFMLMLCIIFDNRDIRVDKIRGLRSLATDLSPRTMRFLILLLFLLLFTTNFLFRYFGITAAQSLALQVSTVTLLIVYYCSTKKQGYYFYYFGVDGLMLFSALGTYIASI